MIFRRKCFFVCISLIFLSLAVITSCFQPVSPRGETGSLLLNIDIPSYLATGATKSAGRFIHPDTNKIVITVTGDDMLPVKETKSLVLGKSEIVIEVKTIPVGRARTIHIALYDANDTSLAEGRDTIVIEPNIVNDVSITIIPVTDKTLEIGTASEVIDSTMKGKTLVYSVAVAKSGIYLASSDPHRSDVVFNVFNSAGTKVPADPVASDTFSLSDKTYYLVVSLPSDYSGGATIQIAGKTAVVVTYTVTYEGNGSTGGTVPVDATAYVAGTDVTVPTESTLVKTGAVFAGWNTAVDGTGVSYVAEDTLTMGSANVTLYAQWIMRTLSVTVSFANPTEPTFTLPGAATVAVGSEITITAAKGFTSYQWLLNGVVQTNVTTNSITLTPTGNTLDMHVPGLNRLTLIVQSGEEVYSAEFKFTITQ